MTGHQPDQPERLLFPLQGVDSHDDDALEAFAHRAWQAATHEWENTMNDQPGPSTALTDKYTAAIS